MLAYALVITLSMPIAQDTTRIRDLCLCMQGPDERDREYCEMLMIEMGSSVVPYLLRLIDEPDSDIREGALLALRLFDDRKQEIVPAILMHLKRRISENDLSCSMVTLNWLCDSRDTFLFPVASSLFQQYANKDSSSYILLESIKMIAKFDTESRVFLPKLHDIIQNRRLWDEIRSQAQKAVWKLESR